MAKVSHQFIIIWLSMAAFLHNILMNGANNVIISSLQKEFYLSSRETGIYVSVYDIGSLLSSIFISFASARGSKPRWIAFGMCMLFIGCMVNVLPHFIKPKDQQTLPLKANTYDLNSNNSSLFLRDDFDGDSIELCNITLHVDEKSSEKHFETRNFLQEESFSYGHENHRLHDKNKVTSGGEIGSSSSWLKSLGLSFQLKHLLYAANIINGLSSASMTTITFSYIEDIAPHSLSAIYEGIYYAVGAFGVGVGFMVTSKCLTIHTDIDRVQNFPSWLKPSHPNWIGAWWLPFLIFGGASLLLASVIFIFPKKINDTNSKNEEKQYHLENRKEKKEPSKSLENRAEKTHKIDQTNNYLKPSSTHHPHPHHHHNALIETLEQTGSLLSLNKLGDKSSMYNLNNLGLDVLSHHTAHTNDADDFEERAVAKAFLNNGHLNTSMKEEEEEEASFQYESEEINEEKRLTLVQKSVMLLKNPVYLFLICAAAIEGLLQNSFLAFASLFLEYQYRLASGSASLILGFLSIPPLMIGGLLSGFIVKRLKDKVSRCLKFLAVVLFINLIVYAGFIVYCKEPTLISDELHYNDAVESYHVAHNCNCDAKIFKPVCLKHSHDTFFQSACLAGCVEYDPEREIYYNCSQVLDTFIAATPTSNTNRTQQNYFTNGLCATDSCNTKLIISYACIALLMLLNALTFLPYLKVTIGCINAKEMNSIGLGMKQFFMNAFGTIPGPIIFGSVIDHSCKFWHTDASEQSVCKMYDNKSFALGFGLLGIGFKLVCFVLVILSLIVTNRRKKHANLK